jgi:PmbA protein
VTNLYLEAGSVPPEKLRADVGEGFYVTDLIGMGVNTVTGDYSRGAAGIWIKNGDFTHPVSEVTIAGHLNDMFRSLEPASDLEFRYGVNAPTLRVEGLTIAGQ